MVNTYTLVGNVSKSSEDGFIWTAVIQRTVDSHQETVTFNKNMTIITARAAITAAFQAYDTLQSNITTVNNLINTVLTGF